MTRRRGIPETELADPVEDLGRSKGKLTPDSSSSSSSSSATCSKTKVCADCKLPCKWSNSNSRCVDASACGKAPEWSCAAEGACTHDTYDDEEEKKQEEKKQEEKKQEEDLGKSK